MSEASTHDPLMTGAQLAALCGTSIRTIEDWRARKIGPPWIKIGKLVRYNPVAVQKFLMKNTFTPAAND